MASRLSQKRRDKLFKVYCEKQSVHYVSKKCRVSPTTVRKYRTADRWDERLNEIRLQAAQKADEKIADNAAENLKLVRAFKVRIAQLIYGNKIKSQSTAADLNKMIRLEEFLNGKPDSRPDLAELRKFSTDELLKMKQELEKGK